MQPYKPLLVTAIIPCFNHEKWVKDAIMSIVDQDYEHLRLIVVDDCSKDDSFAQICSLIENAQKHVVNPEPQEMVTGNIKNRQIIAVKFSQNLGVSVARNYGIQSGDSDNLTDVYAFLDSDDIYLPGKISKSVEYFENNEFIGTVYSDYETVNTQTGLIAREFKQPYSKRLLEQECIINMDSLVSKQALLKSGCFIVGQKTCEDYSVHLQISKGYICSHIPESLVRIRIGNHSTTANIPKEQWETDMVKTRQRYLSN